MQFPYWKPPRFHSGSRARGQVNLPPVRNASTKPQTDCTPGMMRPGIETHWGASQPAIVNSHPKIKRVRCAVATTKKIAPQTRKYVLRPIQRLQSEGFCPASNDRSILILV